MHAETKALLRQSTDVLLSAYRNAYGKEFTGKGKLELVNALHQKGVTINRRGANAGVNGGRTIKSKKNVRTTVRALLDILYDDESVGHASKTLNAGDMTITITGTLDEHGNYHLTMVNGDSASEYTDHLNLVHELYHVFGL